MKICGQDTGDGIPLLQLLTVILRPKYLKGGPFDEDICQECMKRQSRLPQQLWEMDTREQDYTQH
jgi:hypothetical protein